MNSGYEEIDTEDYDQGSTITVVNQHGTYIIESNREPEEIGDFVESMVRPILLAMGYGAESVAEVFNDIETSDVFVPTVWQSAAGHIQVETTFTQTQPMAGIGTRFVCLKDIIGCEVGEVFVLTDQGDNTVEAVSLTDKCAVSFPIIVEDQDNITKDELREIFGYELRDFVQVVD